MKDPVSTQLFRFCKRLIIWDKSYTVGLVILLVIVVADQVIDNGESWYWSIRSLFEKKEQLPYEDTGPDELPELPLIGDDQYLSGNLFEGALDSMAVRLDTVNWKRLFGEQLDPEIIHDLYSVRELPVDHPEHRHVYAFVHSNPYGNDCTECYGRISMFEFRASGDEWKLTDAQINFDFGGYDGKPPLFTEIVGIGKNNRRGIMTTSRYEDGSTNDEKSLFVNINGSLKRIFIFESLYHYEDYLTDSVEEVTTSMTLVRGNNDFFDIILHSSGFYSDSSNYDGAKYVFDGKEYIQVENGKKTRDPDLLYREFSGN